MKVGVFVGGRVLENGDFKYVEVTSVLSRLEASATESSSDVGLSPLLFATSSQSSLSRRLGRVELFVFSQ